jgi:hypothetical protein
LRHHGANGRFITLMFHRHGQIVPEISLGPGVSFSYAEIDFNAFIWTDDGPRDRREPWTHARFRPPRLRGSWFGRAFEINRTMRERAIAAQREIAESKMAALAIAIL